MSPAFACCKRFIPSGGGICYVEGDAWTEAGSWAYVAEQTILIDIDLAMTSDS